MTQPKNILKFLHTIENLKVTKRTGWIEHKIANPESIADHMHRMGVMAMLLNDPAVDRNRVIQMAIVHDLAESIAGDIAPSSGMSKEAKAQLEKQAMDSLVAMLEGSLEAREIESLFMEYEDGTTPEAVIVKDLDKFEMIVQAFEYEQRNDADLQSFFDSTRGKFKHPTIISWVTELEIQRNQFHSRKQSAQP
ncbi:HD domain-containing protein [Polychytrium aggregatum]|uniref:HD domain-containing protein n=1 Tax=Polychytrium aggregatum TaxID=110093 RepID=UPI0022FE7B37|nr:HD domain-containing protein [Polychytrium aggregatum]KAI9207387.1 HD domain-containing protein [Polychytrium aggregatum]